MTTNQQDEATRLEAERMQQEQAERDFVAAREQLAAEDAAARQADHDARERLNASPLAGIGRQQEPDGSSQQMEDGADIPDGRFHLVEKTNADGSTALYQEPFETFEAAQGAAEHRAETAQPGEAFNAVSLNLGEMVGRDYVNEKTAQSEALTLEAIERDSMNAINLPLPGDASSELLKAVHMQATFWAAHAQAMGEPDNNAASGRMDHAALRLSDLGYTLEPSGVWVDDMDAGKEPFRSVLDQTSEQPEAEQQPEDLTLEAIQRDPWNAVNLPIPDNADCELLGVIEGTAGKLADAKLAELSQLEEARQMGAPVTPGAWDAAQDAHMAASTRAMEAEECLEELACLAQGDGERQPDTPQIDAADSFRMGADAATNTEQGQKERDLAARILALENLTGNEATKDHYAFVAGQRSFSDRIADADTPDMREVLQGAKFAHAQNYAADLCEQGQIQHGLEGRFEEAALLGQEGRIHREIAERFSPGGPENTPPDRGDEIGKDTGSIADSMTAAAAEALGPKTRVEFIVDGPSREQQQGERPDPHFIHGEAGKGDYAALREETAALGENDERAKIADHGLNIRAVMEVAPEGTYIASRPQASYAAQETDYENGPTRPAFAALAATQEAARDDRAAEETRIAESSEKAKREDASGAKDAELAVTTSDAAKEATSRPLSRAERAELAAAEYAAEAGREQESGHAMGGGGRGGR